ncbi:MAG: CPBP family intramembrane metalloprotease [Phycisphaerae bacterium]|nr:CPBP family intramembrane metalloprotease [Phycisphaerae bacterium]
MPAPRSRWLLGGFALLMTAVVIVLQRVDVIEWMRSPGPAVAAATEGSVEPPSESDPALISARIFAKWNAYQPLPPAIAESNVLGPMRAAASGPADELRVAMMEAEFLGAEKARERVEKAAAALGNDAPLSADARTLLRIYARAGGKAGAGGADAGAAGDGGPSDADLGALRAHHGWFGRLACTFGRDARDAERAAVVGGGERLLAFFMFVALAGAGVVVLALGLAVTALALGLGGHLGRAFARPSREERSSALGGVFLETYTLFVCGFAALKVGSELLANFAPGWAWATLLMQWALMATLFWPLLRGLGWRAWRERAGWHAGRGVLIEMAMGVLGYLALLPIFIGGVLTAVLLVLLQALARRMTGSPPEPPPSNRVFDLVAGGSSLTVALLFMLATIWAPVVEETIFRGSLFRHLRGRFGLVTSALATAAMFALVHPYPMLLIPPVAALGFMFALLREWRGSLIGPMAAHGLHNATVLTVVLTAISLI